MFGFVYQSKPLWSAILSVLALSFGSAATHAQEADKKLLDLSFVPPQIIPTRICVPRAPDAETIANWENWDGTRLPNIDPVLIKRDINRLQQIDPNYWLLTIDQIITRLAEAEPSYAGNNALLARISAMVAAGAFEELNQQQLVAQLAAQEDMLSPRLKNALSDYFRDGIGVARDIDHANALLVDAGYAGNADALLTLTKMELEGGGVEGWDVAPDLAVTMAFGSLVGELDPSICDRVARIAREYSSGEIVQPNPQLAHDWFRFAADLGDSNSAWKIVEFHMQAEGFDKDNAVLLQYLTQAADAQLPYAQIALGRVYETGALVEQDLSKTLSLFRAAARSGLRPGLTRLALFLEKHADRYPELQDERMRALHQMADLDDVGGWVFTRLAEDVFEREGRWAGHAEAMPYLEKAAALGDMDGAIDLALELVAHREKPEDFERAVDLLSHSVSALGGVTPAKLLHGVFMCQAQDSPRLQEALYWQAMEAATDTANVEIAARDLMALAPDENALTIALIQSHALYGRPRAMASYLKYLENAPEIAPEVIAFWRDYSNQYASVLEALADLEFELAESAQQRDVAFDLLRQQYQQSGATAALALAEAMIAYESDDAMQTTEIRSLLEEPASAGKGAAMRLLASLDADSQSGRRIFDQFADVIETNGDFDALVFAIPYVNDETQREYLSRATGIIPCDYKNVMTMSRLFLRIDDTESALHWMGIAEHLMGDNAWSMVDLAQSKLAVMGVDAAPEALELFQAAAAAGDDNAPREAFELLMNASAATYNPDRAARLIGQALEDPAHTNLGKFLGVYRASEESAQAEIARQVDMPSIYLAAAETGDIFSMRSYALYLRENAASGADLTASTQWLNRAAEGGDTTAMAEFGYALAFGIGTDADLDTAINWLERAAANGSEKAAAITALLQLSEDT